MFALHLKQLYRFSDKVIVRTLRNTQRLTPFGSNPGLDNRLRSYESEGLQIRRDEDPEEFMERSESDFINVGEAYNEHMNETLMGKYEMRHKIVKEKYFKEHMPNLLTWSEKEQIRYLAAAEPEEWTLEKLAESFPVTVPVLKRLLKYPWKPATEDRIARHDASVMRNWKELTEGSIDIPEEIRQHFLKFSNRSIPPLNKSSIKVELKKEEKLGEFESIVQRCAVNENTGEPFNNNSLTLYPEDTHTVENTNMNKKDSKRVTLEELATKIKKRLETGRNIDMKDQMLIDTMIDEVVDLKISDNSSKEIESFNEKVDPKRSVEFKEKIDDPKSLVEFKEKIDDPKEIMTYPERIRIPKKAYKKGATYKVNDCFYDHDGKFLYRVLGMSN